MSFQLDVSTMYDHWIKDKYKDLSNHAMDAWS